MTFKKTQLWHSTFKPIKYDKEKHKFSLIIIDASSFIYSVKKNQNEKITLETIMNSFFNQCDFYNYGDNQSIIFCLDLYTTNSLERNMIGQERKSKGDETILSVIFDKIKNFYKLAEFFVNELDHEKYEDHDLDEFLDIFYNYEIDSKDYYNMMGYPGFKKILYKSIHSVCDLCGYEYFNEHFDKIRDYMKKYSSGTRIWFRGLNQSIPNESNDVRISNGCIEYINKKSELRISERFDGFINTRTREADNMVISFAIHCILSKEFDKILVISKDGDIGKSIISLNTLLRKHIIRDSEDEDPYESYKGVFYLVNSLIPKKMLMGSKNDDKNLEDMLKNDIEEDDMEIDDQFETEDINPYDFIFNIKNDFETFDNIIEGLKKHIPDEFSNEMSHTRFKHSTYLLFLLLNHIGGSDFCKTPPVYDPISAFNGYKNYLKNGGYYSKYFDQGHPMRIIMNQINMELSYRDISIKRDDFLYLINYINPDIENKKDETKKQSTINRYRIVNLIGFIYEEIAKKNKLPIEVLLCPDKDSYENYKKTKYMSMGKRVYDISNILCIFNQAFYGILYYMNMPMGDFEMPDYMNDPDLSGFDINREDMTMKQLKNVDLKKNLLFSLT